MSESQNTTIDDSSLFELLGQIVTGYDYGVHGIDKDDLCKAVMESVEDGVEVERSKVLEMIADNMGPTQAFTRLYNSNGPVVLSKNFWPIVNVIRTYDGKTSLSTVIFKLPLYLPSGDAVGYNIAAHYLSLIETMVECGYLKLDSKMQLSLDDNLIYDE